MRRQFIDICTKITQNLLPQQCLLCGCASGFNQLCSGCEADLPFHDKASCPVCAIPTPQAEICGSCLKHTPHFDATYAAFAYAFPMDALLRSLKYQGRLGIAELVARQMAKHLNASRPDLIVPMPLHPLRLRERGFNQAIEMARMLSKELGIPLAMDEASRTRPTEPQAALPLDKRAKNICDAFACSTAVASKHIAVVDDVMTSGASLNELAKTLKKAGAARVECWVAARTLRD